MIPHLLILIAVFPLQLALGWWIDKHVLFDSCVVWFCGTIIFVVAEMAFL